MHSHLDLMTNFYQIQWNRYSKPISALKENLLSKGIVSLIGTFFLSAFDIIHTIEDIFRTPFELVLLLLIAITVDFLTGIKSAKDNKQYIFSIGLRQLWVKILEYSAGLLILTGIANVFGTAELGGGWVEALVQKTRNLHWAGYLVAIFTEFKSIIENVQGKKGRLSGLIEIVEERIFDSDSSDK